MVHELVISFIPGYKVRIEIDLPGQTGESSVLEVGRGTDTSSVGAEKVSISF